MRCVFLFWIVFQKSTNSLFFPTIGMGSSNCQCQTSCGSPSPPSGCFCPPQPAPTGCGSIYSQTYPSPSYPSYNPTPQQFVPNTYPTFPSFGQQFQPHPLPPPPPPLAPIPMTPPHPSQLTQYRYDIHQSATNPQESHQSQETYTTPEHQQIKLEPPSQLETEYMNQLVKVLDTTTVATNTPSPNNYKNLKIQKSIPRSYFEMNVSAKRANNENELDGYGEEENYDNNEMADEDTKTIADSVKEIQETSTDPSLIPHSSFYSGKEIKTTEIQISQQPYEIPAKQSEPFQVSTPTITTTIPPTTTPIRQNIVAPSSYKFEPRRYEGRVDSKTPDISESGYEFTGPSSSIPPITLEYLSAARNVNENEIDRQNEIDEFTKDVNKFEKSSGSTIALPPELTTPNTSEDIDSGYGSLRDIRDLEDTNPSNKFSNNNSENEAEENENSETTPEIRSDKTTKCNNSKLKDIMHQKMTISPSISKQMIYSAASEIYPGRNVNVICSKHSFSYIVVTSPVFCEHRKRPLTCFAFFQP